MKNFILLSFLLVSFSAVSAVHGYWIEETHCGKIAGFSAKVCLLDVANKQEHFVVIMDYNQVEEAIGVESVANVDVLIEKKGLKKASGPILTAIREFNSKNLQAFMVSAEFVKFTDLRD
ncbi:MAG TPA: hypothetical protein VNJ01_14920 [Bacteriovoracaceae bacterium]|nr:hypothetical protein [Bacteriovoracaceae bacterium]